MGIWELFFVCLCMRANEASPIGFLYVSTSICEWYMDVCSNRTRKGREWAVRGRGKRAGGVE